MTRLSFLSSALKAAGAIALVAALWGISAHEAGAARERGAAGSRERNLWCQSQEAHCLLNGIQGCDRSHPDDASAAEGCYEGVEAACRASFGTGSDCRTTVRGVRPLPTGPRAPVSREERRLQ